MILVKTKYTEIFLMFLVFFNRIGKKEYFDKFKEFKQTEFYGSSLKENYVYC